MDDQPFEPRLGKPRSPVSYKDRKYLSAVIVSAARSGRRRPGKGVRFTGSRIGRGSVAARMLTLHGAWSRRASSWTRLVRLSPRAMRATWQHLRYIQRDGVSSEGEHGRLYSAREDVADGRTFLKRCDGDRHQFRVVVSAEDGAQYDDLRPLVRRFMARMEEDLGTSLDWVAADHHDTFQPHTHIILRGKDELGGNLVIAPAYIQHGMRDRLSELVSLDLGPRCELEVARRLRIDIDSERLTATDRSLLRGMNAEREVAAPAGDLFKTAIRAGRLKKLAALGLAHCVGGGRWRLSPDLESVLQVLGERGDIARTMQRKLAAIGVERGMAERCIYDSASGSVLTGRIIARGLCEEHRDLRYLIVDGVDGRIHYVGKCDGLQPLAAGAIVRVTPRTTGMLDVDRPIEAVARAKITADDLKRVEAHEAGRTEAQSVTVELLSPIPLENLGTASGATWLDHQLISQKPLSLRESGFGREVCAALAVRRAWLVAQGLAREDEGRLMTSGNLIAQLERRELRAAAVRLSGQIGKEPIEPMAGTRISGIARRRVDLASGRFFMIESAREFALVPWRPVLERALGRRVSGIASRDRAISWSLELERGLEI